MGTITGISDLDPVRWKNSQWRSLQVGFTNTVQINALAPCYSLSILVSDSLIWFSMIGWVGRVGSRWKEEQSFNLGDWTTCCSFFHMPPAIFGVKRPRQLGTWVREYVVFSIVNTQWISSSYYDNYMCGNEDLYCNVMCIAYFGWMEIDCFWYFFFYWALLVYAYELHHSCMCHTLTWLHTLTCHWTQRSELHQRGKS
jgi:hypothetical protein